MTSGALPDAVLTARGLRHSYGATPALRGLDLDVYAGEILAVMGPSGSGKSTLLHILAGVFPPDGGGVEFAGVAFADLTETERSDLRLHEFGFVYQFGQLLPDLSAVDNVMLPLMLTGMRRRRARDVAAERLAELGLGDHLARVPTQLSAGQAQRVAVARALVTRPRVLFADEPTGALDTLAAEQTMTMITDAAAATGMTVVLVTHDRRIAAHADRHIILRDGELSVDSARASL